MSSSMTIKGFEEIEAKLREKFSETRVKKIESDALKAAADEAVVDLKSTLSPVSYTHLTLPTIYSV